MFWFLFVTLTPMTFMAMIGILILMGVVVNNGIVLVAHIAQLRAAGMERTAAIIQAGRDRLRPILMTTLTTLLAMLPLAIGDAQVGGGSNGGPAYYPMARAIIGGLGVLDRRVPADRTVDVRLAGQRRALVEADRQLFYCSSD